MRHEVRALIAFVALAGCGDDRGGNSASATGVTSTPISTTGGSTTGTGALPTGSDGATSTGDTASGTGGPKLDVGAQPDVQLGCGEGGLPEFSYIWIANSGQGTVSKIDTVSLTELGRYVTDPNGLGDPSRTSVNLSGDVAVANRNGGVTKIHAQAEHCQEKNGQPGIQTASDANYLNWGVEECVAWYTWMDYTSQRPVAWTQGTFDKQACKYVDQKVWTAGNRDTWDVFDDQIDVILLNGDTGAIEATIPITGVTPDFYGIYGAAVDGHGNFWGSQTGLGHLVFVDLQTLQPRVWPMEVPGYGITVDSKGYVWTCYTYVARFDPMAETWQTMQVPGSGGGGCMEDGNGTLYVSAANWEILAIDTDTMAIIDTLPVPTYVHGISVDYYGYVWGVTLQEDRAYRVDPLTKAVSIVTGLTKPYTYSDMTGVALSNAGTPSG